MSVCAPRGMNEVNTLSDLTLVHNNWSSGHSYIPQYGDISGVIPAVDSTNPQLSKSTALAAGTRLRQLSCEDESAECDGNSHSLGGIVVAKWTMIRNGRTGEQKRKQGDGS